MVSCGSKPCSVHRNLAAAVSVRRQTNDCPGFSARLGHFAIQPSCKDLFGCGKVTLVSMTQIILSEKKIKLNDKICWAKKVFNTRFYLPANPAEQFSEHIADIAAYSELPR